MQSFEQAPQAAPEGQRARVKPLSERARRPRFVDPAMEEDAMPDTRRTGNAPEQPKKQEEKPTETTPAEDVAKVEQIQEQISNPETQEHIKTLDQYSIATAQRAQKLIGELEQGLRSRAFDPSQPDKNPAYSNIIATLRNERNYLMSLQQYAFQLPTTKDLRGITEQNYKMIGRIEDALVLKDVRLVHQQSDWRPTNSTIDAETTERASKFANSAKKMEKQKKSLWGRFKSLFS